MMFISINKLIQNCILNIAFLNGIVVVDLVNQFAIYELTHSINDVS